MLTELDASSALGTDSRPSGAGYPSALALADVDATIRSAGIDRRFEPTVAA